MHFRHCCTLFLSFLVMACGPHTSEPGSEQMLQAFTKSFDTVNEEMKEIAARCRAEGGMIVNPFLAMKCVRLCAQDPKNCQKLPEINVIAFEKLACAKAKDLPGWNCDFRYSLSTENSIIENLLNEVYGDEEIGTGRFFQTNGQWVMIPSER